MDDFILDEKLKPKKKWGEMSNKEFRREWNKRAEIYIQVEEGKEIERTIKMSKENGIYTKKRTGKHTGQTSMEHRLSEPSRMIL